MSIIDTVDKHVFVFANAKKREKENFTQRTDMNNFLWKFEGIGPLKLLFPKSKTSSSSSSPISSGIVPQKALFRKILQQWTALGLIYTVT